MAELSTFTIVQEGRAFAPVTVRSEGLLLGRARECDLQLNDLSIPLALGGIKEVDGRFYFLRLEPSPFEDTEQVRVQVNGREVRGEEALASGDVFVIGSYRILVDREADALVLRVTYPDAQTLLSSLSQPDTQGLGQSSIETSVIRPSLGDSSESEETNNLVVREWLERRIWKDLRKLTRPTYLEPSPQKRERGTEFNWSPTRDLAPPWPVSFLLFCFLTLGAVAVGIFIVSPSIFAPGRVSSAHTTTRLSLSPAIASTPNANACMSCHSLRLPTAANCGRCHQAEGFYATITRSHEAAGITCLDCHREHQGAAFSAKAFAFVSCTSCHNDNNRQTFNGKTVHTPHGGTFGYPVSNGTWIWKGLDVEAWKLKPEVVATWKPEYDEQTWRKLQFHAIHLYRVKAANGITAIEDGSLSCSSCHKTFGSKFDRETPRQTCAKCHNGYAEESTSRSLVEADKPNCTSCHVQHYYDDYRWGDLLTESAKDKRQRAIDRNYIDAVRRSALAK